MTSKTMPNAVGSHIPVFGSHLKVFGRIYVNSADVANRACSAIILLSLTQNSTFVLAVN